MTLGIFWKSVVQNILDRPYIAIICEKKDFLKLAEKEKFDFALAIEKAVSEEVKGHLANCRKALTSAFQGKPYSDFVEPNRESLFDLIPQKIVSQNSVAAEYFAKNWLNFEWIIRSAVQEQVEYFKKQKVAE